MGTLLVQKLPSIVTMGTTEKDPAQELVKEMDSGIVIIQLARKVIQYVFLLSTYVIAFILFESGLQIYYYEI